MIAAQAGCAGAGTPSSCPPVQGIRLFVGGHASRVMLFIEGMGKKYYCPLKSNRSVDKTPEGSAPIGGLTR